VTCLVGCWSRLAPPLGRNLHCGWRVRSRAVVVSQQGISLLEGRCVSADCFFVAAQASHYQPSVLLGYFLNAYARFVRRRC